MQPTDPQPVPGRPTGPTPLADTTTPARSRRGVSVAEWAAAATTTAAAIAALALPWYEATYVPKVGDVKLPELGNAASKTITATAWDSGWIGKGAVVGLVLAAVTQLAALAVPRLGRWKVQLGALVASAAAFALTAAASTTTPTLDIPIETFSGDPARTGVTLSYSTHNAVGLTVAIVLTIVALVTAVIALGIGVHRRRDGLTAASTVDLATTAPPPGFTTFQPAPQVPPTVLDDTSPFLHARF